MATFTKRGLTWRAEIRKQGIRESATFDTKQQAKAWAVQREAEIQKNAVNNKSTYLPHTLEEALQKYLKEVTPTKRGATFEKNRVKFLLRNLPFVVKDLNKISTTDIATWRDFRLQKIQGVTFNKEISLLSHMFEIARKEWQWCSHNPTKDIRKPKANPPRDRRITTQEIEDICYILNYQEHQSPQTKKQEIAYAFLIALETAMRCGEILGLELKDIHIKEHYLALHITKNNDARNVPLSDKACELLTILITQAKAENRSKIFTLTSASCDALFRKYRRKAGIDDLHFHDTRHEAITRLAQKLDVLDLSRMTGQRNINQLRTYYNATPSEIAKRLNA